MNQLKRTLQNTASTEAIKFIGVDLGWSSGASGLCCLSWHNGSLQLEDLTAILEIADILAWIDRHVPSQTSGLVAVDAPTIITNPAGMRLADRLTHKYFGRYHAGCYPANLGLKFASRTTGFSQSLLARDFSHAPTITPQQPGRYQLEVFPHPATINLFGLEQIIKYKKGRIAERRRELNRLRHYIVKILPQLEPPLSQDALERIPVITDDCKGKELKAIEDKLDSLLCAYIAAHWWYWGDLERKNIVLGNIKEGFIVIPNPQAGFTP